MPRLSRQAPPAVALASAPLRDLALDGPALRLKIQKEYEKIQRNLAQAQAAWGLSSEKMARAE